MGDARAGFPLTAHPCTPQIHSKNLDAALAWVETNRSRLEETSGTLGSFEFHVRKVAFLQILSSEGAQL